MTAIDWQHIDGLTQGRIGRTMAICPLCSADRRSPQKRQSKVLAVTLIEPEFAVYYCNHCEAQGYVRPDTPSRKVIDIAERQRRREEAEHHAEKEKQGRTRQAITLWNEAQLFRGSPAENYLRQTRQIGDWLDCFQFVDNVFRYHPSCPFGGDRQPCMLALVRNIRTNKPAAIHRTALTTDKHPQRIDRKTLGPIAGGAIKISANSEVHSGLLIGEGIETCLSASKYLEFRPVWSLIDANGVSKFPVLSGIESVTIAVDNDHTGRRAAKECIERLTQAGIEVITAQPNHVSDFNDYIMERCRG